MGIEKKMSEELKEFEIFKHNLLIKLLDKGFTPVITRKPHGEVIEYIKGSISVYLGNYISIVETKQNVFAEIRIKQDTLYIKYHIIDKNNYADAEISFKKFIQNKTTEEFANALANDGVINTVKQLINNLNAYLD
jgi:hypothetical protein